MDSSEKRKLVPTGTTPKKAEKLRKKLGESGSSSPRSPLRTTTGFGGKRLFSSLLTSTGQHNATLLVFGIKLPA